MRFAQGLLIFTGVIFSIYGIMCFYDPAIPAGYIGLELGNAGGPVEVMAMYGGLQLAAGLYLLWCGSQADRARQGLVVMVVLLGGLASTRGLGLMRVGIDSYNLGAFAYETTTVLLGLYSLRKAKPA